VAAGNRSTTLAAGVAPDTVDAVDGAVPTGPGHARCCWLWRDDGPTLDAGRVDLEVAASATIVRTAHVRVASVADDLDT
jgi:hypothetical protein